MVGSIRFADEGAGLWEHGTKDSAVEAIVDHRHDPDPVRVFLFEAKVPCRSLGARSFGPYRDGMEQRRVRGTIAYRFERWVSEEDIRVVFLFPACPCRFERRAASSGGCRGSDEAGIIDR